MSQIIQSGDVFSFAPSPESMLPQLPKGVYKILKTPDGYVFSRQEPFKEISNVYGDHGAVAKRIYRSFQERDHNTGVLLAGTKGSGKSYLGRLLSQEAATMDIPTIIVTEALHGEALRTMLSRLDQRVVILIDEFEKIYDDPRDQLTFLSLLDGLSTTKHLFILTVNDVAKVDTHMKNRPGRLYYLLEFRGLEEDFIREYCQDKLHNTDYIDEVVELTSFFEEFNFDMLSSLVEEMNRFQESPREAVRYLNIASNGDLEGHYHLKITDENGRHVNAPGLWKGNPLRPHETPVTYWLEDENGENDVQVELPVLSEQLVEKIPSKGIFRYKVGNMNVSLKNMSKARSEYF